jgi:hypothetical protein
LGSGRQKQLSCGLPSAADQRHQNSHAKCPLDQARGRPDCGSFEVRYSDGRPPTYFYWDDLPSRRLRPDLITSEVALERAKALSRAERDR